MAQLSSTLAANEARTNFYKILEEVTNNPRHFVVTHRGKTRAVIMPVEDAESLEETAEILSTPGVYKSILKSKKQVGKGNFITLDKLLEKYKL